MKKIDRFCDLAKITISDRILPISSKNVKRSATLKIKLHDFRKKLIFILGPFIGSKVSIQHFLLNVFIKYLLLGKFILC